MKKISGRGLPSCRLLEKMKIKLFELPEQVLHDTGKANRGSERPSSSFWQVRTTELHPRRGNNPYRLIGPCPV